MSHRLNRRDQVTELIDRFVREGLACGAHPGIAFKSGPSGRRAALAGVPDVWEIVVTLDHTSGSETKRVARLAEESGLHRRQIVIAWLAWRITSMTKKVRKSKKELTGPQGPAPLGPAHSSRRSTTAGGRPGSACQSAGPSDCVVPHTYQPWYGLWVWTVVYLPEAERERDALPAGERVALHHAVAKLEVIGPTLGFPHTSAIQGAS